MGTDVGMNTGASVAASCAFMGRLDRLTTAVYPFELARDGETPPRFSVDSWGAVAPVIAALTRLIFHILHPYIAGFLLALAGFGVSRVYCATTAATLLCYLFVFDPTLGRGRWGRSPSEVSPGLFCKDADSSWVRAIISSVPALQTPHYRGPPWVIGGDLATLYPFLVFSLPKIKYVRRWLAVEADDTFHRQTGQDASRERGRCSNEVPDTPVDRYDVGAGGKGKGGGGDGATREAVALDLALPDEGLNPSKPFYIVLHGLNGGSAEGYVLDFAKHALKRGCGVCVMISRGCMSTPIRGSAMFHGARTSDVSATVTSLRKALPAETPVAMVGFSMGAIVAANYAAISGAKSRLSSCVAMSGSFDTRTNMSARHSLRQWQPMLARSLKENFVVNNLQKIVARGIDLERVEKCKTVVDFDTHLVTPYNGYSSVTDYYIDMSAAANGKIAKLRTPLLAVSALDDPIMTSVGIPVKQLEQVEGLFLLVTRSGGHVGWPVGWLPTEHKWEWMSSTALDFSEAVVKATPLRAESGRHAAREQQDSML